MEAMRLDHPVYGLLYFVLARREGATLFTLDQKLQGLCAWTTASTASSSTRSSERSAMAGLPPRRQ